MRSLPSRRRLLQPNFFRFKCYRLSPVPFPVPPPSLPPAPAARVPGLLPATRLPVGTLHPVSARARSPGQTRPRQPGTVRQAGVPPDAGAVGRQGRGTFPKSANRDLVSARVPNAGHRPRFLHSVRVCLGHKETTSTLLPPAEPELGRSPACASTSQAPFPSGQTSQAVCEPLPASGSFALASLTITAR